ncbi:MAG: hypothetical protein ACYDIC_04560 [Desulfobaccales bacterium]
MKKFGSILALLCILALAACAGPEANPKPAPSGNFNWGDDATCSPGCPPGMSGSW